MLDEVRNLILQGLGRKRIADTLGLTMKQAERLINQVRSQEDLPKAAPTNVHPADTQQMLDLVRPLVEQGLGCNKVANKLNITQSSASYWIAKTKLDSSKTNSVDRIRFELDKNNPNTYELAKKFKQSPSSINTQIRKAEMEYDPAKDWVLKAAKNGVKFSTLKQVLRVKTMIEAENILLENFPDCFIVQTRVGDELVLTPVYDSKKDVESIKIDLANKPFTYYVSPGNNYMLLKVDDNYGENELVFPVLSDIHKGSVHHRPDLFAKMIEWINNTSGVLPLLVGDLIENNSKASVGGICEQYLTPNDQVIEFCKDVAHFAHLIPFSVEGNHEARTTRFADFSVGRVIADLLKVPYIPNEVVVDIHWRGVQKRMLATHRFGKAYSIAQIEANVLKKREQLGHFDFTVSGHNHKSFILPEETLTVVSGRGMEHTRWMILNNGSCVGRTGGYAENFPPAPQDMVYAIIKEDGSIDGKSLPIKGV